MANSYLESIQLAECDCLRLEARGCAPAAEAGLGHLASLLAGGSGVLEVIVSLPGGSPKLRPSLDPADSSSCLQAYISKPVEGDFTFVTITHLIGFQLNWRGSEGLCLCLFSSFLLFYIKGSSKRRQMGFISSGTIPASIRDKRGFPGVAHLWFSEHLSCLHF